MNDKPAAAPDDAPAMRRLDQLLAHDGADFVRAAYRTLLLRDPDPGGLVAYLTRLQQGTPKLQLLDELRRSPEGRSRAVQLDGWPPASPAGQAGEAPTDSAQLDHLLTLRGDAFVHQAYRTLLDRDPDDPGLAFYRRQLERGVAPAQLLAEIAASDEFRRRNRLVPGLQPFLHRQRQQRPLLQKALGLFRRSGPQPEVALPAPAAQRPAPAAQQPLPAVQRLLHPAPPVPADVHAGPAQPRARPLNPARAVLMSLPDPLFPGDAPPSP